MFSTTNRFVFIFIALLIIGLARKSYAQEPLVFRDNTSPSLAALIEQSVEVTLEDYEIARFDLNGDGLDEFILKSHQCGAEDNLCDTIIIAQTDKTATVLGRVQSRNIGVAQSQSHGVRDLFVYNSTYNDFKSTIYRWEPVQSRYILDGGEQK